MFARKIHSLRNFAGLLPFSFVLLSLKQVYKVSLSSPLMKFQNSLKSREILYLKRLKKHFSWCRNASHSHEVRTCIVGNESTKRI